MEPTIGELERLIRDNCSLLESMAAETQRRRPELGRPEGHSAPRNSHPLLSPRPEGIPGAAPQLPGRTAAKLQHYTGATQLEPCLAQVTLAATHNGWGQEETATHLALALEGPALQVLLDLPLEEQRDLRALTTALGRRVNHEFWLADITDECIVGLDLLAHWGARVDVPGVAIHLGAETVQLQVGRGSQGQTPTPPAPPKPSRPTAPSHSQGSGAARVRKRTQGVNVSRANIPQPESPPSSAVSPSPETVAAVEELGRRSGVHLSAIQQRQLQSLLAEFMDMFAAREEDCTRTGLVQHTIDTGAAAPIRLRPHRLPLAKRQAAEELIKEMAANGVIEPSDSPWAAPVVMVRKKTGGWRPCVDYRRLNAVTRKDSYPLPRIDDALDYIAGSSWFSSLDLRSGYWQVELAAEARPKTAFTIGQGLWQFRVMPFGLCNAPATFERLMERVLKDIPRARCVVYLDDLLTHAKDFEQAVANLREHANADALSRRPCSADECRYCRRLEELDRGPTSAAAEPEGEDEGQEPFTAAELQQHQVSDPVLGMVRDWMEAGTRPDWSAVSSQGPETKSLYSQWNNLELHGGWPEAYAVPDQSAVTTARTLVDEMFTRFGVPEELHSDQGRNFESQVLGEVCRRLGVRKTRTTPLHPQSDGLVERFNRTLATQLAILTSQHQRDWDQHLPLVLWAYRTAVQESSQCTPAALMFGRELRTPVDLVFGAPPEPEIAGGPEMDYFRRLRERLHTVHQLARRTLEGAGARQKRAYDTRAHGPMLGAGDRVWVFCPQRKRGLTPKLMSHWQGPGEILEQLSEVVFRVRMPGRGRRVVLHKDRLAPYHPLAPNPQTGVQPGDSLPPTAGPNGGAMDSQSRPKRTRRRPGHLLDYRVDS
ncbi:unnamed protein product [Oreochromis niloticus]|nr:unnamed protein product [Mustela putorius furo]